MNAFWWSGNGFGIGFLSIRIELRDQNDVQNRADRQTDPQLLRAVKSSSQPDTPSSRAGRALGNSFMY